MQDVDESIKECNPERKRIVFGDMIAGMIRNKKLNQIFTELFIREKKTKQNYCFY